MKTILNIAVVWLLPLVGFCDSPVDEFKEALIETEIEFNLAPMSDSATGFISNHLAAIKKLSPDRKDKLATKLKKIIPLIAAEWRHGSNPESLDPSGGIILLKEIGNDEQKIEAFQNLELYGRMFPDAAQALATCEGPGGVRILTQFVEDRIPKIEVELADSKMGIPKQAEDGVKPASIELFQAMIALQGAYHSSGPLVAGKLRDKFIEVYKDYVSQEVLAQFTENLEKKMDKARLRREKFIRENQPTAKRSAKTHQIDTETLGSVSAPSSHGASSGTWVWLGISVAAALLFVACHILIKQRGH